MPHQLETDIRNAFDAHDRDAFERAMGRLQAVLPPQDCMRGRNCVCVTADLKALCSFRTETYATRLAPCARGPACSCTTFEKRMSCGNASAQPQGRL